jgi:hypothetical protein
MLIPIPIRIAVAVGVILTCLDRVAPNIGRELPLYDDSFARGAVLVLLAIAGIEIFDAFWRR